MILDREEEQDARRAMTLLTQATPPAGLEARVLAGLRQREQTQRISQRWALWTCGAATAAAVLVFAMMPARKPLAVAPASPVVSQTQMPAVEIPVTETLVTPKQVVRVHQAAKPARMAAPTSERSFPAPVAPLSPQERTLLQLANSSHPETLEALRMLVRTDPSQAPGSNPTQIQTIGEHE